MQEEIRESEEVAIDKGDSSQSVQDMDPALTHVDSIRPILAQLYTQGSAKKSLRNSTLLKLITPVVEEYLITSFSGDFSSNPSFPAIRRKPSTPPGEPQEPYPQPPPPGAIFRTAQELDKQISLAYWRCLTGSERVSKADRGARLLSLDSALAFGNPKSLGAFLNRVKSLFDPRLEKEYTVRQNRMHKAIQSQIIGRESKAAYEINDWANTSLLIIKLIVMNELEQLIVILINLRNKLRLLNDRNRDYHLQQETHQPKSKVA